MSEIAELTDAQRALAKVETPADAKDLYDKLETISQYARRYGIDHGKQNEIAEAKLRTARKGGALLLDQPGLGRSGGDRKSPTAPVVDRGGLSDTQAKRWQKLARIPSEKWEQKLRRLSSGEDRELTLAAMLGTTAISSLTSSDSDDWYTPAKYAEAARRVLGGIDLDPASCEEANRTIQAKRFYSIDEGGLKFRGSGRVYTNPPYGAGCPQFMAKLCDEYEAGHVTAAIALINAYATDRAWFQRLCDYSVCFVTERIRRVRPGGEIGMAPTFGSAFIYLGRDLPSFKKEFGQHGAVMIRA